MEPGACVCIVALSKSPELTGKMEKLGRYDVESLRWEVEIGEAGWKKIKTENLQLVMPTRRRKTKLCRYGASCYRPQCWFDHGCQRQRCESFAAIWQKLLQVENSRTESGVNAEHKIENVTLVPRAGVDALASHADVCNQLEDMRHHVESLREKLEKSVQQIVELQADVASKGDKLNASDCGDVAYTASTEHLQMDLMELTDLTASKHVQLEKAMSCRLDAITNQMEA